jgi:hypothetical protein
MPQPTQPRPTQLVRAAENHCIFRCAVCEELFCSSCTEATDNFRYCSTQCEEHAERE